MTEPNAAPVTEARRYDRFCDHCKVVDNHPRHTTAHANGTTTDLHMDCCASQGCDICQKVLESAGDKRGLELAQHITSGGIAHLGYDAQGV